MRVLYANKLLELGVSDDARIAWIRRSATPSREGDPKDLDAFLAAVERLPCDRMAVLVDLREAPGRNDDDFEHRIVPQFNVVTDRFAWRGTVVKTEVGKIQVLRMAKERGQAASVFTDVEEARSAALSSLSAR